MAEKKVTATSGNYDAKGLKYRTLTGIWVPTLPRGKAGWQHILDEHERKHEAKQK